MPGSVCVCALFAYAFFNLNFSGSLFAEAPHYYHRHHHHDSWFFFKFIFTLSRAQGLSTCTHTHIPNEMKEKFKWNEFLAHAHFFIPFFSEFSSSSSLSSFFRLLFYQILWLWWFELILTVSLENIHTKCYRICFIFLISVVFCWILSKIYSAFVMKILSDWVYVCVCAHVFHQDWCGLALKS